MNPHLNRIKLTISEARHLLWLYSMRKPGWVQRHNYDRHTQKILRRFARRGWVRGKTTGAYQLTALGRRVYRAEQGYSR